jgi:antitoxin FitA
VIAFAQRKQQNAGMTSITIRDVPDDTRNELAARARRSGRSMQEYLREQLVRLADRPDPELFWEQVRRDKDRFGIELSVEEILDLRDADKR